MRVYTFYNPVNKYTVEITASGIMEAFKQCPKTFSWVLIGIRKEVKSKT